MSAYETLPTPAVAVELDIVEKNIKSMLQGLKPYGIRHRPHIKSHKSVELAKLQLSLGAEGITCAKLGEAEVMAAGGIRDILIAYPIIGRDKLDRYARLHRSCTLRSIINSAYGATALSKAAVESGQVFEVLVELDGGVHRGGVAPGEPALQFVRWAAQLKGLKIVGLLYYPGLIYGQTTVEGLRRYATKERDDLVQTAELLERNGYPMPIRSGGNTPSAKQPDCLAGITEVRAGNYIFNDCAQLYQGRVSQEDCALRVVATVVAKGAADTVIIDAGSKTLSSDSFLNCANQYGYCVNAPALQLANLNEEHGYLRSTGEMPLSVGDRVILIPNHACVVSNLTDSVYALRNGEYDHRIKIDARGCVN